MSENPPAATPVLMEDPVNILLVDDQPGKLLGYQAILAELGETLLVARSAREALETLLKQEVALILIDVIMPELDGFELAEMIRSHPRFEKVAMMFVSGVQHSDLDRVRGYSAGAVDFVAVPVVPEILRAKVRVFADLYRKTRQLETLNRELEHRIALRTADLEAEARRKDEFLATLAHELRNPLAPITACLQMMRRQEVPATADPRELKTRQILDRQVSHLVRLVDDLLDVSRISRGAISLDLQPVDLAAVVRATLDAVSLKATGHRLSARYAVDAWVNGDAVRLSQVVSNIVHNAEKFTPRDGRIELAVDDVGDELELRVKDSGRGIEPRDLERVFELFAQVSPDRAGRGLGIGLALVRRLIELHGGRVRAHSDGPGCGTEIIVCLPKLRREAVAVAPQESTAAAAGGLRVLIVDDNVDAADTLAALIEIAGHATRVAYEGPLALEIGATFAPDVVLLDIGMPVVDGIETARRMRQTGWGRRARLVAMTGWGQPADRERTREAGFDSHLVKPVDPAVLLELLAVP